MGFIKTKEEIKQMQKEFTDPNKEVIFPTIQIKDAQMLTVIWETKEEIVKRVLPKQLKPLERPIAFAFFANYPRPSFCPAFREAALFIGCKYNNNIGSYCLSMPNTDDMSILTGREFMGFPKKIADISYNNEDDNKIGFSVKRHGKEIVRVNAEMNGNFNENDTDQYLSFAGLDQSVLRSYAFRALLKPNMKGFAYWPRLIEINLYPDIKLKKQGTVNLEFFPSENDPWNEIEMVRLMGAVFTRSNNIAPPSRVLKMVNPFSYVPHSFKMYDELPKTY
jgi:acetoacetate decarboxylase